MTIIERLGDKTTATTADIAPKTPELSIVKKRPTINLHVAKITKNIRNDIRMAFVFADII
ncbi:hypothetical protein J4050_00790 [Winogradskyella sp. DF17]|uniref:Uncharacterized protein n=1 Tax=Winogradskyella pelagia TaxID=2819984 RepID=A0ABS3SXP4_9FLAO|nr:hypothetical protein [Winogradskyella sp. DF17]MBO3115261.1 hypothetical protein [Winogradskyella sp. DF17]